MEERWARTRVRQIRCLGLLKFFILGISHPSAAYSFSLLLLQEVQWRAEHEAGSSLLTVAVQWPTVLANSQVQKKGLIQHHRPLRVTPLTYLLPFQAPSLNPLMILTSPKSWKKQTNSICSWSGRWKSSNFQNYINWWQVTFYVLNCLQKAFFSFTFYKNPLRTLHFTVEKIKLRGFK